MCVAIVGIDTIMPLISTAVVVVVVVVAVGVVAIVAVVAVVAVAVAIVVAVYGRGSPWSVVVAVPITLISCDSALQFYNMFFSSISSCFQRLCTIDSDYWYSRLNCFGGRET